MLCSWTQGKAPFHKLLSIERSSMDYKTKPLYSIWCTSLSIHRSPKGGGPHIMTHHHFSKTHCSNDDVILSNTYGHQTPPLPTYAQKYVLCSAFVKVLLMLVSKQAAGSRNHFSRSRLVAICNKARQELTYPLIHTLIFSISPHVLHRNVRCHPLMKPSTFKGGNQGFFGTS